MSTENMNGSTRKYSLLIVIGVLISSIGCSLGDDQFVQNQNMTDGDVNIHSEVSLRDGDLWQQNMTDGDVNIHSEVSLRDGDLWQVNENKESSRGDREQGDKYVNGDNDNDGRIPQSEEAVNKGSESPENSPGTGNGQKISDSAKGDRMENSSHQVKIKPRTAEEFLNGMQWILKRVSGEPGLKINFTEGGIKIGNKDNGQQNVTTNLLRSENGTTVSTLVDASSNLTNITVVSNVSTSQPTNASHSYNVSTSDTTNVTNATHSNSTSSDKSPSETSSAAAMLLRLFLTSLYVAGPSAGIFLVSPIYAIAARNLLDYFLGSPDTVDLLHGAGILGLVVDLTWGAVD